MSQKIYIAGPDVFYPKAVEIGEAKKVICAKYGFVGVFPLDLLPKDLFSNPRYNNAQRADICKKACIEGVRSCDIVVANMSPFRGTGMDVGTAAEMAAADMIHKPVYGYSTDSRTYLEKLIATGEVVLLDGCYFDKEGQLIEDLDRIDNCMVTECCQKIIFPDDASTTNLEVFEKAIAYIHEKFKE